MHRHFLAAVLVGSAVALTGCVINVSDEEGPYVHRNARAQERHNRDAISQLELGATVAEVRTELGEPDSSEAWLEQGAEVRVLRYRTHRTSADGDTTEDETTPLVFKAGKLVAIGERAATEAKRGG
jgi:hypothetical protein